MSSYLKSKALLQKLAGLKGVKRADDLSSTNEFEKAFSNLALAVTMDQFPQLSERILGFQTIEKSEDERKAVGVLGLDLGGKLALAPFFFNKGELVGSELLWLADGNVFVPKIPEWIDHLVMHHNMPMGTLISENIRPIQPTMDFLRFLPTKAASADWLVNYLPDIAYARLHPPGLKGVDLEGAVRRNPALAKAFIKLSEAWPAIKLYKQYGVQRLLKAAKESARQGESILYEPIKRQRVKTAAVEIITNLDVDDPRLSVEDRLKIKKDGYLVIDRRKSFAKYAKVEDVEATVREQIQVNVTEPGVYKVLSEKDGKFHRALVIPYRADLRNDRARKPDFYPTRYETDRLSKVYVKFLDGDEEYMCHPQDVAVLVGSKESDEAFQRALKNNSVSAKKTSGRHLIVDKSGNVIHVFQYDDELVLADGDRPGQEVVVIITETPTGNIVFGRKRVFVPPDARMINLAKVKQKSPSGGPDLLAKRVANGDFDQLTVIKFNDDHFAINGRHKNKREAVSELLIVYGLNEKGAEEILRTSRSSGTRWIVSKTAEQISLDPKLTPAPGFVEPAGVPDMFLGSQTPTKPALSYMVSVSSVRGIMPVRRRANEPINPELVKAVQEAAQTGQKEVFDTTTLSSLLSIADDREIIDKHLPDVLQAVDALGRILFAFYWHSDEFERRYGQYDVERIKNMLSAQFKQLGKLAVMLKEQQQTAMTRHIDEGTGEFGSARELG